MTALSKTKVKVHYARHPNQSLCWHLLLAEKEPWDGKHACQGEHYTLCTHNTFCTLSTRKPTNSLRACSQRSTESLDKKMSHCLIQTVFCFFFVFLRCGFSNPKWGILAEEKSRASMQYHKQIHTLASTKETHLFTCVVCSCFGFVLLCFLEFMRFMWVYRLRTFRGA